MNWVQIEDELETLDAEFELLLSSLGPNTSRCSTTDRGRSGRRRLAARCVPNSAVPREAFQALLHAVPCHLLEELPVHFGLVVVF